MKRLASLFLIGSLAFAGNIYIKENNKIAQKVDVPLLFKTTALNNIQNVAISNDDKKVIMATRIKVKIFDTKTEELIKTLRFENPVIKAQFSTDNKKIFILTNKEFYIYDSNKYKMIGKIDRVTRYSFDNFFIKNNFLTILEDYNPTIVRIFNLKTGNKIVSFKINGIIKEGDFSPNLKKIALTSNQKSFIYNLDGELLHKLPELGKYYKIKWLNNKDVVVESTNRAYIFDIKTSEILNTIKTKNNIAGIEILDNKHIATFIYNYKMKIFDINKNNFLNKEYILKGESSNDYIESVDLSDDKILLAIAYNSKNMKLYKTSEIFKNFMTENDNLNNKISQVEEPKKEEKVNPQIVEPKPKVIIKKEIVEKVVVKKIKEHENKKPTLYIYASQTEGNAPLTVNFKFVANDEDGKIASYYVNFAGKEIIHKGNPTKSFNYTFKNAGKYKIMVAVKDNKGAITTKQVTINVKPKHEENFEDYKRSLMGQ